MNTAMNMFHELRNLHPYDRSMVLTSAWIGIAGLYTNTSTYIEIYLIESILALFLFFNVDVCFLCVCVVFGAFFCVFVALFFVILFLLLSIFWAHPGASQLILAVPGN